MSKLRAFVDRLSANATGASTALVPSQRPAAAFFRWQSPGDPIAVHFHLNMVSLLERDAVQSTEVGIAGILLGSKAHGRTPALMVEDYESIPPAPQKSGSVLAQRQALEAIADRWQPGPQKRISTLGFYRSCAQGEARLSRDDLELLAAEHTRRVAQGHS